MSGMPQFHAKHGQPFDCISVPDAYIKEHQGKLPEEVLAEWASHGWCGYNSGFLWTVDPAQFDGLLKEGQFAFMRTAFGSLFYWDGRAHNFDIMLGETSRVPSRIAPHFDSMLCDDDYLEEALHYKLFKRALAKLGRLNVDECYGFLPPIPLGGSGAFNTLQRVKMREHMAIVQQL